MGLSGYLKIDDIDGESKRAEHEDEIDVHGVHWKVAQSARSSRASGRSRARARVDSLTCYKTTDAASVYLALACMQGKSFSEVVLSLHKDGSDSHSDYLIITMTNVVISEFEMLNDGSDADDELITEQVGFSFERVKMKYTVPTENGSAGGEHEITYDIAAGV